MIHYIIRQEESVLLAELIIVHAQLCLMKYTMHEVVCILRKANLAKCRNTACFILLTYHKIKLVI